MYKYKKGDLVRHKPSGCVGEYEGDPSRENFLWVAIHGHPRGFFTWMKGDCEPVTDHETIAYQTTIANLRHRIEELEKQPVDAGLYEAAKNVNIAVRNGLMSQAVMDELEYAIANSTPVEPQGWITDRRPTEDDCYTAQGCEWVFMWSDNRPKQVALHTAKTFNHPWQPVPQCLRTPPQEQPKCETCDHYFVVCGYGGELPICAKVRADKPYHGMPGCVYSANENV